MLITAFRIARPRYEVPQELFLDWLAEAHTRAETARAAGAPSFDAAAFRARMRRLIRHVCCGRDKIAVRGYSAPAGVAPEDGALLLDDVTISPAGPTTAGRTDWFEHEVAGAFARLYEGEVEPPDHLVHVTCTGYVSPSGAQRLAVEKGWGARTRVTHAYHMGCHASVPALRIALGLEAAEHERRPRVDVVHTELCSLHFDASAHTAEQLVVQSLFADGSVRYALRHEHGANESALEVLALHEVLDGGSEGAMRWCLGDHGMRMSLSRDVPSRLAEIVRPFAGELFERGGLDLEEERERCVFAVHPGGPKIIDVVRDALGADERQVSATRGVLRGFGNMSSATLPHIWSAIASDRGVEPGTVVASIAFGPGLTVAGALFRKV